MDTSQTNVIDPKIDKSSNDVAVSVSNLSKNYGEVEALKDMSLEFPRGQLTSLLGPSGCGKNDAVKNNCWIARAKFWYSQREWKKQ